MHHNPGVDLVPVQPEQAVNIARALEVGNVPAKIGLTADRYNNIENPNDIVGDKPRDIFDSYRMSEAAAENGTIVKAPTAEPAPVAAPASSQE